MHQIGKAVHDIVYVEYDIKAKHIQQAPRKTFLYKRADMDGLRDHLAQFKDTFLSSDHSHMFGGPHGRVGKVAVFQRSQSFDHLTAVSGVGSSPALLTCEISQVLLAGVSSGFPGVLPTIGSSL